ncbi:MAG: hypothetical protein JSW11_15300 [Candidatus Heimdallarchaeota archaeon]|nr:MAG: hypothetical protein JSW11_15300 [Candidatus Heimdallarchaeota archaeon]
MSNKGLVEKLYCAKYTLVFNNSKMDKCAFISASSAQEAWDLTETLASFWNTEEKAWDSFRIQKVFKQPCSKNPIMIWSKKIFSKIRKQGRSFSFS